MIEVVLVAACSRNRAIGHKGQLPWLRMAADMRRFRQITLGGPVIMGRKTFESLGSKPLPERLNLIVSKTLPVAPKHADYVTFRTLEGAIAGAKQAGFERVFVIGGGEIYQAALPLAHRLELTEIDVVCPGDVFFPAIPDGWLEAVSIRCAANEHNPHDYTFKTYVKLNA